MNFFFVTGKWRLYMYMGRHFVILLGIEFVMSLLDRQTMAKIVGISNCWFKCLCDPSNPIKNQNPYYRLHNSKYEFGYFWRMFFHAHHFQGKRYTKAGLYNIIETVEKAFRIHKNWTWWVYDRIFFCVQESA